MSAFDDAIALLAKPKITQADIAIAYAECIHEGDRTDWPLLNLAIINRWSRSGLERIKAEAWKWIKSGVRIHITP